MFDVVLHEPEIPNNTGNIGRTCVATGCRLRLIEPIGFDLSERACRRAGLDYWPRLDVQTHTSYGEYLSSSQHPRRWFFSGRKGRLAYDAEIRPGDHLVFGKESVGLPDEILDANADHVLKLPLMIGERSLNVATVVCTAVYEGLRQCIKRGDLTVNEEVRFDHRTQADGGT